MRVRLIPFADVFVDVIMTESEAAAVVDALATARERGADGATTLELEREICDALDRADALKKSRGY